MNLKSISRALTLAFSIAALSMTVSAQSFTVHLKNGDTQSYNNDEVERIVFSPDNYVPGGNDTFVFEEPANTYIVSRPGEYDFKAVLPSGKEIEGISKVDWIWAQKLDPQDTDQKLVSDVRFEDGRVRFKATGNYGNVAVAGFNGSGKIVWVWLLWMTPQPEEKEFEGGGMFLDRFMGATSANPEDNQRTWGVVLYQWGRPVPIFGGFEEEFSEFGQTFDSARKWTVMNPEYGLEWKVENEAATMEESIAAPTTFFTKNGNWLPERSTELWAIDKTDYDPSPAGYKLPAYTDWGESFFDNIVVMGDKTGAIYSFNGSESYFPHGIQNRLYDTGVNVLGLPGFMSWNCEYYLNDFSGVLDNPNFPYTLEEAIEMGYVYYTPSRLSVSLIGGLSSVNAAANPSFAIPIRCVRIKK